MTTQPTITVLAFGSAAEVLGWSSKVLASHKGQRVADVLTALQRDCPRLAEGRGRLRFAVNRRYADEQAPLQPGDELALIPPVSGGEPADDPASSGPDQPAARLVREPIEIAALAREVEHANIGAITTFAGVVRAETALDGRPLAALDYTAFEDMALAEMFALCNEAAAAHALHRVILVHRLGRLGIGDTSVAVVVSSPHRAEAFAGCRAVIEGLKVRVPIWKQEIWADGGRRWVE